MRISGVPRPFVEASIDAARRTREPLAALLPLLWLSAGDEGNSSVETCALPTTEQVENIPLYTFDMHTRVGRQAIDRLAQENGAISDLLARYGPECSAREAVRVAAFYADAACVSRRLVWPLADRIEQFGIASDLLKSACLSKGMSP